MSQSTEKVVRYLTGKENLEVTLVEDLQKLVKEDPYFSIGQFLLAKKLKAENGAAHLPQVQKAALFFSNPLWLHHLLNEDLREEKVIYDNYTNDITEASAQIFLPENEKFRDEKPAAEAIAENNLFDTNFENNDKITELAGKTENVDSANKNEENSDAEKAFQNEAKVAQPEEEMAAITRDADAETEKFLDELVSEKNTFGSNNLSETFKETDENFETQESGVLEEDSHITNSLPAYSSDNNVLNKKNEDDDEHEKMFQNIKAMLDATSEEANADVKNAIVPIDPYHTIDYFASQGIKLEFEQNPKDELGRNLKKFTQWLKQMKRLGPEQATEVIAGRETEADITKIAESSNTVREVVTEAMASVLEKQGKKEKATELYNKLSFLNPDKSVYFAAKIKSLKDI